MPSRSVVLHGHIFKNAGTTLDWSLNRLLGDSFVDHRDDEAMMSGGADYLAEYIDKHPNVSALSSHHTVFPLPEIPDVELLPLYLLRHPLERISSVYRFERWQQSDSRGAKAAKKLSFVEYVAWRLRDDVPPTIRNYQCLNISGAGGVRGSVNNDRQFFLVAAERLQNLPLLGIVDRYDESMVIFESVLRSRGWVQVDLAYVRQNASTEPVGESLEERIELVKTQLSENLSSVMDRNQFDMTLYRQASQRLDQEIEKLPDFERRLEDYRQRCTRLNGRLG